MTDPWSGTYRLRTVWSVELGQREAVKTAQSPDHSSPTGKRHGVNLSVLALWRSHRRALLRERILLTPLRNQRRLKRSSLAKSERVSHRPSFESYVSVAALCGPTVLNTEIGSYSSDRRSRQHASRSESEASRSCKC